jgi:hypothetical protein
MDTALVTTIDTPRQMAMVPSVTISELILSLVTSRPFSPPTTMPAASAASVQEDRTGGVQNRNRDDAGDRLLRADRKVYFAHQDDHGQAEPADRGQRNLPEGVHDVALGEEDGFRK